MESLDIHKKTSFKEKLSEIQALQGFLNLSLVNWRNQPNALTMLRVA